MHRFSVLALSCASLAVAAIASASAGPLPRAPLASVRTPIAATVRYAPMSDLLTETLPVQGPVWPDVTPSVVGTYIATVLNISGTPCFDCVNGNTKGTLGSGYPLGYVNLNTSSLGVLLEWFDVSYKGTCKLTVTLTLAGKTLKTASASFNPTVGSIENTMMAVTRSSSWHGAATMTGKIVCGGTTAQAKGVVHFQ